MQASQTEGSRQRVRRVTAAVATVLALCVAGCSSTSGRGDAVADAGGAGTGLPMKTGQVVAHGKPESVSVTDGGLRSATVSWSKPALPVYRYRVERAEGAEGPYAWVADLPGDALTFTDGQDPQTRLKDAAAYYYRLSAILDKEGVISEPTVPVKTVTAPPPAPPASCQAEATGSRAVTVTWAASPSDGLKHYRVQRAAEAASPEAFEEVGTAPGTEFVDGGTAASTLKDSTRYRYRVLAVNRVDAASEPSPAASVLTLPPPAPPAKVAAESNGVRCVPLAWEASPEPDVVRYEVYQARSAEGPFKKIGEVQGREVTAFTDGGGNPGNLEDEGTYYYRVRAVNGVTAESADSQTVRATTRAVPPVVQRVAVLSARPREVPVAWAVSPDDAVTGYEVWRAMADSDEWVQVARLGSRTETNHLDRGGQKDAARLGLLADGTVYHYRVIAFNTANVRSSASVPVQATTKVIPATPSGLEASAQRARGIRLTWAPNPEKDIGGYLIEVSKKPDGGFRKLAYLPVFEGGVLEAEDTGLEPGAARYYRVRAIDKDGLGSLWSETAQGTAKPLPDAPSGVSVQREGAAVRIVWTPPPQADVAQYRIWAKKLLGWDLLATVEHPACAWAVADLAKAATVAVTAVDKDQLESAKSDAVKVDPLVQ